MKLHYTEVRYLNLSLKFHIAIIFIIVDQQSHHPFLKFPQGEVCSYKCFMCIYHMHLLLVDSIELEDLREKTAVFRPFYESNIIIPGRHIQLINLIGQGMLPMG